jgi:hypothetical protein
MTVQAPMLAMPSRTVAPTPESTVVALHARGDYLWQPKWDGIRAFAYVEDGTARLINRLDVDISDRYPDVIAALADAYPATESRVFDGELLVFHDGRPGFARIHRRDAQSNARRIYHLTQSDPATFVAFDLLYVDGRDIRHDPLTARLSLLSKMVDDGDHLMISPTGRTPMRLTSPRCADPRPRSWDATADPDAPPDSRSRSRPSASRKGPLPAATPGLFSGGASDPAARVAAVPTSSRWTRRAAPGPGRRGSTCSAPGRPPS